MKQKVSDKTMQKDIEENREDMEPKEAPAEQKQKEEPATKDEKQNKPKKKNGKISKPRLFLAILLLLVAVGAVYFIQSESSLDTALEESNYSKALSCVRRMPWISLTDKNLHTYLDAQTMAARGDITSAVELFKTIGGYRDSTELCLVYATLSRAEGLSLSANPDELLAGYEKMKELTDENGDTDSLFLYRKRMYETACEWITDKPEDTMRVLEKIPEYPEAERTRKVAEISRNFNISDNDEIYEKTMAALKPLAANPQAGRLLISDNFINAFLKGEWKTKEEDYYYEHTVFDLTKGTGQHKTNLPHPAMVSAEYTDGKLMMQLSENTEPEVLYSFEVLDYDTIHIVNHYDNKTYTFYRVIEEK